MLVFGVYFEIILVDVRVCCDEVCKLFVNGVDLGDKKKNDKVEQSKVRIFKEVVIEWYGINKKWFEDYVYCVLKSFEDNFFVAFGERNIVELKI